MALVGILWGQVEVQHRDAHSTAHIKAVVGARGQIYRRILAQLIFFTVRTYAPRPLDYEEKSAIVADADSSTLGSAGVYPRIAQKGI